VFKDVVIHVFRSGSGEWMLSNSDSKKPSGDLNLINPLDLHLSPVPIQDVSFHADQDSQDQWAPRKLSSFDESESEDAFGKEKTLSEEELSLSTKDSEDRFLFQKSLNPFLQEIVAPHKDQVAARHAL
jgi:hypothetical protein